MKGRNRFSSIDEIAIKAILTRIYLGFGNTNYLRRKLRSRYFFFVSDFSYYTTNKSFSVEDFDSAKINGDINIY